MKTETRWRAVERSVRPWCCALAWLVGTVELGAQVPEPVARERERMDRAVAAAQAGRLDQAAEILQEGIPTAAAAVDRSSAQAHRLAALAFRLQELDHAPQARELAEQALQVCSALLEEKALVADPGRNARLLALTGRLLERAAGQRREAMEAYLLAWQLDPERQVEALRAYQALAERERVILEREAEAARGKEARR